MIVAGITFRGRNEMRLLGRLLKKSWRYGFMVLLSGDKQNLWIGLGIPNFN